MMAAQKQQTGVLLSELLRDLCGVQPEQERHVHGLALDSRHIRAGDLFLACAGDKDHGLRFVDMALTAGASAVAWEPVSNPEMIVLLQQIPPSVPVLAVPGLRYKVGLIADRFFGQPSQRMQVIGITGTNGKTSCSHFLAQLLNEDAPCGVIGTLGCGLYGELESSPHTTPDAVTVHGVLAAMSDAGAKHVAMEVSSHGLAQGRVAGVQFAIGVFTNLTQDHLDYHGNMEEYARVKKQLFQMPGLRAAVINHDDPVGRQWLAELGGGLKSISYGLTTDHGAPLVHGHDLTLDEHGIRMRVQTPWGEGDLRSQLVGAFNASNLLAVLSALLVLGWPLDKALLAVGRLRSVPGRMEHIAGQGDQPQVVVDYAHTPDALRQALTALRNHCQGRLWCVFGCGGDRDRGKRAQMGAIAEQLADAVVVTDDNPRNEEPEVITDQILQGFRDRGGVPLIHDRAEAIEYAIRHAGAGDMILIAGKGHEDYQLVRGRVLPFDDREQARRILQHLRESGGLRG